MKTIERFAKLSPNKQSLLTVWLDQHKNGSGHDAADADKQLVAYVVMENGAPDSVAQLRDYMRRRAPGHMVPDSFVPLPSLPLTTNGKVDRARLSEISKSRRNTDDSFVAPRTELEEELAGIWAEILKVDSENHETLIPFAQLYMKLIDPDQRRIEVDLPEELRDLNK